MEQDPTDEVPPPQDSPPHYLCPNCGARVPLSSTAESIVQCPQCQTQFFAAPGDSQDDASDEHHESDEEKQAYDAELSEFRIRRMVTERRAAYRRRSYLIIGTSGCAFVMLMLFIDAFRVVRLGQILHPCASVLFAIAAAIGTVKFGKVLMAAQDEINETLRLRKLEEEEAARHEPDLSKLSDGSQYASALQRMVEGRENGR